MIDILEKVHGFSLEKKEEINIISTNDVQGRSGCARKVEVGGRETHERQKIVYQVVG